MSGYTDAAHRLARWYEIPVAAAQALWDQTIAAWKQAMAEFGIPEHPGGECPAPGCCCSALEPLITDRAYELLGLST